MRGPYFAFDERGLELPFISAVGSGAAFAYHAAKTADVLALAPLDVGVPTCLCAPASVPFGQGKGTLVYDAGEGAAASGANGTLGFKKACALPARQTNDMITQLNRQIDKAVFDTIIGTGDGDSAAAVSAAAMLAGEAALAAAGVDLRNVKIVADSVAHALIAGDDIVANVNAAIDRSTAGNFSALGYPYAVTDLLPANGVPAEGSMIMFDPNQAAVLGLFGGLDINVNPYVLDLSHEVRISIHRYADSAVLHAGAAYTFHDDAA